MLGFLRQHLEGVPEHRTGQNTQYSIAETGLSAFSVFYMQSPVKRQLDLPISDN
jgi:hypothetical protein